MNTASSKAVTPRPRPGSGQIPRAIPVLIAEAIGAKRQQVDAAIALLDGGATAPFISRYRKEATGGLSDSQLRLLDQKLDYLRDLDSRRLSLIALI